MSLEWQPEETAPKNGVLFNAVVYDTDEEKKFVTTAYYDLTMDSFYCICPENFELLALNGTFFITHWKPMPTI